MESEEGLCDFIKFELIASKQSSTDFSFLRFTKFMQSCAAPGGELARIATANSAALTAPGFPMASVPTGIPPASGP